MCLRAEQHVRPRGPGREKTQTRSRTRARLGLCRLQERRLFLGGFLRARQRSRALPRMIGDVEHHTVGSVKLGLIKCLHIRRPPREAGGAELLQPLGMSIDVLHQYAEVMDAAEVETRSLIPAEPQDRETNGAVAQEHAI